MQITPDTAKGIAKRSGGTAFVLEDLATPQVNIAYGSTCCASCSTGMTGMWLRRLRRTTPDRGRPDEWGGASLRVADIPYPETKRMWRRSCVRGRSTGPSTSELGL